MTILTENSENSKIFELCNGCSGFQLDPNICSNVADCWQKVIANSKETLENI